MGIIITRDYVITVCLNDNLTIMDMAEGRVKGLQTSLKTRFLLLTLLRIAARFLIYLKQIDKIHRALNSGCICPCETRS